MPDPLPTGGVLAPGQLLTISAAKRCLGCGDWAWRKLSSRGLPTIVAGRQRFVFSDDLLTLFARLRDEQNSPADQE